jgi:hypothetical protein
MGAVLGATTNIITIARKYNNKCSSKDHILADLSWTKMTMICGD